MAYFHDYSLWHYQNPMTYMKRKDWFATKMNWVTSRFWLQPTPLYSCKQSDFHSYSGNTKWNFTWSVYSRLHIGNRNVNPLIHNTPNWWSDMFWKSCSICYKVFKVCLTIFGMLRFKGQRFVLFISIVNVETGTDWTQRILPWYVYSNHELRKNMLNFELEWKTPEWDN